ncbi:metallophosphoesterase [Pseudogemmobacter bohemicus]|uniref:metallophosphoesterase n=1 Tax=Pseudogemmobacter bohemicus TaxID=2250708 RepID=UPI000DD42688|nr:metallophosphoesterase [Pseudogemmobacter bohemicus]
MSADPARSWSAGPLFSGETPSDGSGLLRIIATSDLHAQILSYDYFSNRQLPGTGLAQIACLIAAARESAPASLLLDNGDFLQGGALAEIGASKRGRRSHPAITAFNTLGYDAVALGNHEFDYGLEVLNRAIAGANFPVLSANVLHRREGSPVDDRHFATPAVLLNREIALPDGTRRAITIGIFGLTPPETLQWNARWIRGQLDIRQMEETARAWVPELRARGADVVICLAHTGIAQAALGEPGETQAAEIASIPGLDAVIAGHSHLIFPDRRNHADPRVDGVSGHIAGTPVVQPGHEGSHLGLIDLWLRPVNGNPNRRWQVTRSQSRLIAGLEAVAGMPARAIREASAPLRLALAQDHSAALFRMRQRLATLTEPLSTWFANVADSQAMRLIGAAVIDHTRSRLAGGALSTLPVVALVSSFRSGGRGGPMNYVDIPPGNISLRHVFSLYPFPNTLTAILTTGAELSARLDLSSALFNRIVPGIRDQLLTDPGIPAFSFASAIGASYQIDLSLPAAQPGVTRLFGTDRIRDLRIGGHPIAATDPLILVVNNYVTDDPRRAAGQLVLDEGRLCTDVITDHIREAGRIGFDDSPGWRFVPMPGTSVLYDSGSGAAGRLGSAAALRPEAVGLMPSGFSRFRLHL